jgi:anti-sigma-K factor RskA
MDYGRPELADRLAAEYVLGTLRGPARRRFEALLAAHPALRSAVRRWEEQLSPLADSVPPVAPPERVWAGIETRLFPAEAAAARAEAAAPVRWWNALGLWRGLSALASTAAVALLVVALQAPPVQPPIVVVLATNPGAGVATNASFVASLSADGRALVLKPLNAPTLTAAQALELWSVPAQGGPRSLGLVRADTATTLLLQAGVKEGTAAFAVSIEPAGGSPTGAPTGPIVSLGQI